MLNLMLGSLLRQLAGGVAASLITSGVLTGEQSQAITGGAVALFTAVATWLKNRKLEEKISVDNKPRYN